LFKKQIKYLFYQKGKKGGFIMDYEVYDYVRGFVQNVGMSARPEFYSGRDAMTCDLNKKHLEGIYEQIINKYGSEAGNGFIAMVKDIKVMTATKFLNSLYTLCRNDWNWKNSMEGDSISIDGEGTALGTIFSVVSSSGRDETEIIKGDFLRNHGIYPEQRRCSMYGSYYYEY
jgi:hypothetical protein